MADDGDYGFTRETAERITRAVQVVESKQSRRDIGPPEAFGEHPPIRFRNDSPSTADVVPARGVAAIIGTTVDADYFPLFKVTKPSTNFYRTYLVNGNGDVGTSDLGFGYMTGTVEVLYLTPPTTSLEGYGPKAGSWALEKYYPNTSESFGIISSSNDAGSSDTPTMWATLHPINEVLGKLASTLSPHGTANVTLYAGSSEVSLSMTLSGVRDWLLASTDTSTSGPGVGSNCLVSWRNGQPYFDNIACTTA